MAIRVSCGEEVGCVLVARRVGSYRRGTWIVTLVKLVAKCEDGNEYTVATTESYEYPGREG